MTFIAFLLNCLLNHYFAFYIDYSSSSKNIKHDFFGFVFRMDRYTHKIFERSIVKSTGVLSYG